MTCPVCRAQLDLQRDCPRCGLTTGSMRRAARAGFCLRQNAFMALYNSDYTRAAQIAAAAQSLHHCVDGADLQWLIALFTHRATS